jgi:DNA-binding LacI/PurR family transcriptional regulator
VRGRKAKQAKSVGIILPEPLHNLRPLISLWIDELKQMLLEEGCLLRVYDGQQYYRSNPRRALDRLVAQNHHDVWVPVLSSKAMQQWFARHRVRCLVAGSIYPDADLPFCDLDFRAICRHATGVLLRHGHRKIALLNRDEPRAGEVASEEGFSDGIRLSGHPDITPKVVYHRDDVDSVNRALRKLRGPQQSFPTALIVNSAHAYLAVTTLLASQRLRVPQDVSLVCRDGDPILNAVFPTPARYVVSPHSFAKRLIRPVTDLVRGLPISRRSIYFLPEFKAGGSIGDVARGKTVASSG